MNLQRFGNVQSFEDIEYTNIFMASLGASENFYGAKGFDQKTDETKSDLIVVLGPLPHPSGKVSSPFIYNPSVLSGQPVFDLHTQLQLAPSIKLENTKTFYYADPRPGELVFVQDKMLLALVNTEYGLGRPYFNVETGEITRGLHERHGFIITSWKIQTTDPVNPEIVLSFPYKNS